MKDSTLGLSSIEKDTIGEIMNISMGSAATAVSTMLNRRVSITTPEVILTDSKEFTFNIYEPAVCTEIKYLDGLDGSNFMVMKREDVNAIVKLLINEDNPDDGYLDEIYLSAVGEIMNQMMGSSSTALASFFGHPIEISIPNVYEIDKVYDNIKKLDFGSNIVVVKFQFKIDGVFESEFVSLLPMEFTKTLVKKALSNADCPDNTVNEQKSAASNIQSVKQKLPIEQKQSQVNVRPLKLSSFEPESAANSNEAIPQSINVVLDVPVEITVEIGRAKKLVKDILEIRQGNIIELDKQAGDPVDIFVNGQLLAKGDVVVIDDNFGVRITEIVSRNEIPVK